LLDRACEQIGIATNQYAAAARSFRLDFSHASIPPPVDAVHAASMARIYDIDVSSFIALFNDSASPGVSKMISVQELKIETGNNGVTAQSAPVFFIILTGTDSRGATFSISRGASGPRVSDFQGKTNRDSLLTKSATIGLLSAFVRVIVDTSKHLDSTSQ